MFLFPSWQLCKTIRCISDELNFLSCLLMYSLNWQALSLWRIWISQWSWSMEKDPRASNRRFALFSRSLQTYGKSRICTFFSSLKYKNYKEENMKKKKKIMQNPMSLTLRQSLLQSKSKMSHLTVFIPVCLYWLDQHCLLCPSFASSRLRVFCRTQMWTRCSNHVPTRTSNIQVCLSAVSSSLRVLPSMGMGGGGGVVRGGEAGRK